MKSIFFNKICALIISFILIILSDNISAQFHYSPPAPSLSSMNNRFMLESLNRPHYAGINTGYNFRIIFNDGTEILATGTMNADSSSYYLLIKNKAFTKRIQPAARNSTFRNAVYFSEQIFVREESTKGLLPTVVGFSKKLKEQ